MMIICKITDVKKQGAIITDTKNRTLNVIVDLTATKESRRYSELELYSDISANANISLFLRVYFFVYFIWVGRHRFLLLLRWPIM